MTDEQEPTIEIRPSEVRHLAEEAEQEDRGARRRILFLTVAFVILAAFSVWAWTTSSGPDPRVDQLQAQVREAQSAAASNAGVAQALGSQIQQLGEIPVVTPPPAPPSAIPSVPAAESPSPQAIQDSVDAYFLVHPPKAPQPTLAEVTAAVGTVLADHPPVTPAMVSQSVADYLVAHPPASGKDGQDGKPGPGPTDDQVAASVAAYCGATSQPCKGPAGQDGTDGKDGADGADGKPPVTQTFFINGQTYECDRDSGSPDDAPTYTCALQATPPTTQGG